MSEGQQVKNVELPTPYFMTNQTVFTFLLGTAAVLRQSFQASLLLLKSYLIT